MRFFPVFFALTLPLAFASFELLSLGLWKKEAIAQPIVKISQANQVESTHKKLMNAARAKYTTGDLDGAIAIYQEARQIAKQQGNILEEVEALDVEARFHNLKAQYSRSEDLYHESLLLLASNTSKFITSEQLTERNLLQTSLLIGLGTVYKNIGEDVKAAEQFKSAITQSQGFVIPTDLLYLRFSPRFELATIYAKQHKYSESIALYQEGIALAKQAGDRVQESLFLVGLGSAYMQAGDLKRGREFMNQARKMDVYSQYPELREERERAFDSLDVEFNRMIGIASFLEGSVQLLQRSNRELRRAYQLVSSDSRFSVVSEFADSIEEVIVQFSNLSGFLKEGDLTSVVKVSGNLANVLTKFASYNERLALLMEQMQSQPDTFRKLMNSEVLPSIQDVMNNLNELVNKFGGSDGNEKSFNNLKKN